MKTATRVFVTLATFVAVYFFTFWIPFSLVPQSIRESSLPQIISLLLAMVISHFIWTKTASATDGFISHTLKIGIATGATGFVLGFFGPMILDPGANQGPLLGLFITGPLGLLMGLIGGAIHWMFTRKGV